MMGSVCSQAQYLKRADLNRASYNYSIQSDSTKPEYPNPKSVVRKSLIIPGWGQVVNKQAWKVPIVYGLIGGLGYY